MLQKNITDIFHLKGIFLVVAVQKYINYNDKLFEKITKEYIENINIIANSTHVYSILIKGIINGNKMIKRRSFELLELIVDKYFYRVSDSENKMEYLKESKQIISRIYFDSGIYSVKSEKKTIDISRLREIYIMLVKIINYYEKFENENIAGDDINYLIETLKESIEISPIDIGDLFYRVVKIGIKIGYQYDYFGKENIKHYIEKILYSHSDCLKDEKFRNNFFEIFNILIKTGWNEAIELFLKANKITN